MPCLPIYADDSDLTHLLEGFNAEEAIAFLVPRGPVGGLDGATHRSQ
jgi:hypothetical protein